MANQTNLIKWAGQPVSLTISNKAQNNTGIKSVAGECSYEGSYFINSTVTSVTNANAGNIGASVVTFQTYTVTQGNYKPNTSYVTGTPSFVVNWNSGGKTHKLTAPNALELRMPADTLSSGITENTYFWLDEQITFKPTISHSAGVTPYCANTANVIFSSEGYPEAYFNGNVTTANTLTNLNVNTNATFAAVTYANVHAYINASETFGPSYAGPVRLDKQTYFYVRNSVNQIELNDSVSDSHLYITKGNSGKINYTVIPVQKGIAYSYAVTLIQTPSDIVSMTKVDANSTKKGTFTFEGLKVGTTKLQLKSTAHSTGNIVSPIVTIYVSSDVTEIYLNCADKYEWEIPSGVTAQVDKNDIVTINDTAKPGKLVVSALSKEGTAIITLSTGATLTVHVSHLTIALA